MRIDVVTIFPPMFAAVTDYGVAGRALEQDIWQFHAWDPRDFSDNAYRSVDDRPYGGGPGMVMRAAPLHGAIEAARRAQPVGVPLVYLSPQGARLDQAGVARLARLPGLILLAGRYEGVDERLLQAQVDEEVSIGDYVVSGGELAAMVLIDAVLRQLPGVLGNAASASEDSFAAGLLDCPHYTRPDEVAGRRVPAVLLSGDHAAIRRWRLKQALGRTWQRRPDLLAMIELTVEQRQLLEEFQYEQTHSENM